VAGSAGIHGFTRVVCRTNTVLGEFGCRVNVR
jgi:hypothetical protein